jgi:iron(III) transport system substrate-binding protein
LTSELLAGAKKEGKLMIYHLVWKEAIHAMIAEFKKKIPFIEVDTFMAFGGPMHLKFTSEVRSGRAVADLWQHTAPHETDKAAREGLLLNYVVNSDAAFPADMKNKGW